jgi:type I site-specific restriction endonuclease
MKKSYSQYTAEDLNELGIDVVVNGSLFTEIIPIQPSDLLIQTLLINRKLPLQSEKAKSELLISPVLNEIWAKNSHTFTYFSGYQFNVDSKRGLKGFCDYILSKKYNAVFIESPVCAIVEAKHNQDLVDAVPQCGAEMYAACLFNQQHGNEINSIYGIVTTGFEWLFLKLTDNTLVVDEDRYFLNNLPELLGCWQQMINEI